MHPSLSNPNLLAVFFDAVGTLIFPEPAVAVVYSRIAAKHGFIRSPQEMRARFLPAFRRGEEIDRAANWVTSEPRELERWQRIVFSVLEGANDPEACFQELYEHFARPEAWRVHADAASLFNSLTARGISLGLASNFDCRLLPLVDALPDLAPLRDRVVVSSQLGFRKPAREFFDEVARIAGHERGNILFVGDDLTNDYEGASAAGMQAILLGERGLAELL